MNKKLIYVLLAFMLVAVIAFAACHRGEDPSNDPNQDPNQNPSQDILALCESISDAKSATQVITVKNGSDELAKETRNYDFVAGKVTIERKTLNSSDADELYTTTTETKDITGKATVKLTKDLLNDVTETSTTLKAKVQGANLNGVFGVQSSDVQGDARIELVAQGSHIVSITVSYTSANGNAVQVVTTYVY